MVTENSREVKIPEEVVRETVARYPGIPKALVVARYLLYQGTQFTPAAGTAYGRPHMVETPKTVGRRWLKSFTTSKSVPLPSGSAPRTTLSPGFT